MYFHEFLSLEQFFLGGQVISKSNILLNSIFQNRLNNGKLCHLSKLTGYFLCQVIRRERYGGIPVTFGVTLYILSIGYLSEKFMDFTFDMSFRQFWTDPRLAFDTDLVYLEAEKLLSM